MKEAIIQYNDNPDADGGHMVISWKPLVRCKNCKWFEMPRFGERGFCRLLDITTGTVWFCADGERKEGEGK